jgi:hypothetical protein
MKIICSILTLIIFQYNGIGQKKLFRPNITVSAKAIWSSTEHSKTKILDNECMKFFFVARVTNNSDSTVEFWMQSCSWQSNWVSDNDSISFISPLCDGNGPISITLNSGKSIVFYGKMLSSMKKTNNSKCRIGLVFYQKMTDLEESNFNTRNKKIKYPLLYWSNEIELKYNFSDFEVED